ncbi:hypothetical protein GYMLUDRAFT_249260 [Collybiopsis luxurians FD-317 M1]|uniref:Uncharacterized protein n=1 Tax=Collybiopsis luxurians FD-317 M1 TaxID=944289 RepID=A0A0D0BIZ1_9AGAR|nr:hypothetical protein GYMLUDRAFT_249260 [Collybiopsis luxurians FD-317 M1]
MAPTTLPKTCKVRKKVQKPVQTKSEKPHKKASTMELKEAEEKLMATVQALKGRNCIKGDIPSLDDLLNLPIKRIDADSEATDHFADGDKELAEIVDYIQNKNSGADKEEDDDNDDNDNNKFHFDEEKALAAASYLGSICSIGSFLLILLCSHSSSVQSLESFIQHIS